jgi:hypothetical protein
MSARCRNRRLSCESDWAMVMAAPRVGRREGRRGNRPLAQGAASGSLLGATRARPVPDVAGQASAKASRKSSQLPKRMAQASSLRVDRRDLLWSTTPATWRRPVGAQRDIRARDRSASLPSWLAVAG